MLDIHGSDYGLGGDLSEDEITVIRGALDLSNKTATSCMTPLDKVLPDTAITQRLSVNNSGRNSSFWPGSRLMRPVMIVANVLVYAS